LLEGLDERGRATLFTDARTANTFSSMPVSDEELLAIWQLAKWAPTSANTQPLRVLYVRQGAERERLVPHMYERNRAKVATAPAVAVLAWDTRFHDYIPEILPFRPQLRDALEADLELRTDWGRSMPPCRPAISSSRYAPTGSPQGRWADSTLTQSTQTSSRTAVQAILVVNIGHPGADAWSARLPRLGDGEVVKWA